MLALTNILTDFLIFGKIKDMKLKLKYVLPIAGVAAVIGLGIGAAVIGLGIGASPRAVTSHNDIIFGENGPIKLIAPSGVVLLTNITQAITADDYIHAGGGGSEVVKRYPFFILDLNDGFSIEEGGTTWLGVELKASTNNFGMTLLKPTYVPTQDERRPCFWSCTEVSGEDTWVDPELQSMDECMAFTTYPNATNGFDNRAWYRIFSTMLDFIDFSEGTSLKFPRKIGVLVDPDKLKTTEGNTGWLRSDNDEIVWCYMRTDATGYETNAFGKAIWTMCEPACWFKSVPTWAISGVNQKEWPIGN